MEMWARSLCRSGSGLVASWVKEVRERERMRVRVKGERESESVGGSERVDIVRWLVCRVKRRKVGQSLGFNTFLWGMPYK